MTRPEAQSAWIVLPCMVLSILTTRFLTALSTSPNERGLSILAKATLIFITMLILSTTIASSLFQPAPPPSPPPPTGNVLHTRRKLSQEIEQRVRTWRENTAPPLGWSSDSSDEVKQGGKQWKKKKLSKEKRERLDEKSLRKRLSDRFKPKRYEMLGIRRETMEEVVREDPLV